MEKIITIYKELVYEAVDRRSAYVGKNLLNEEGNSLYKQVSTTNSDRDLLDTFFQGAISNLTSSLKSVLNSICTQDGITTISLNLSQDFNEGLSDTISNDLISYLSLNILAKWFSITAPNLSVQYAESSSVYLNTILQQLFYKQPPKKNR